MAVTVPTSGDDHSCAVWCGHCREDLSLGRNVEGYWVRFEAHRAVHIRRDRRTVHAPVQYHYGHARGQVERVAHGHWLQLDTVDDGRSRSGAGRGLHDG